MQNRSGPCQGAAGSSGFTLLEVLVALVVLGFLMAGLTQGLRFGFRVWDQQSAMLGRQGDLDAVDRTLRRLLASADPGTSRVPIQLRGEAGWIAFTGDLGQAAEALNSRSADLRLEASGGKLLMRWQLHRHARPLGAAQALPAVEELLDGVARLELSYWGGPAGAETWRDQWAESTLPALIRLRLVFIPGDRRRWPDIVAAPRRGRADR